MPDLDPTDPGAAGQAPASRAELSRAAAEAVLAVPGVSRIEPDLRQALRNLGRGVGDGLPMIKIADRTDVAVEISVTDPRTAYQVAQDVRAALRSCLTRLGHQPGNVTVAVLGLS
ncbi:hypothetical protein [Microlunatus sp. GCM10028923]|uniref:hypothetical protein n=1 Tax=Microlunatus sp. GCM10028923 TaxID=3273400 RepID=UPI003616DA14